VILSYLTPFEGIRWLLIEQDIEEKHLNIILKARNGAAPSHLAELLKVYAEWFIQWSGFPSSALPTFKLNTVGDRSFVHQDLCVWTLFHLLVVWAPKPALIPLMTLSQPNYLTRFLSLPATSVARSMRKRAIALWLCGGYKNSSPVNSAQSL